MPDFGIPSNEQNNIDIELPESEPQKGKKPAEPSRKERRDAIAQARAIRREAAAKERAEKQQAEKAAKAVLAGADPEKSKKAAAKKPAPPQAVKQNSGMFGWLDLPRRKRDAAPAPETEAPAAPPAKRPVLPQTDTDAIIAEIVAEVTANAEQKNAVPLREDAEDLIPDTPLRHDADTDALVAQIVAETQAKAEANRTSAAVGDAETIAAEIMARQAGQHKAPDVPAETQPEAPLPQLTSDAAAIVSELRTKPEVTVEDAGDESKVTITEKILVTVPIKPEEDPLGRALAAETIRQQEKKRAAEHAVEMEQADADYKAATKTAKRAVKKMSRKADKAWQKEAGQLAAERQAKASGRFNAVVNITLCMTLLFGVTAGMLLLEHPTVSYMENRNLATMPDFSTDGYLSGEYTNGVAEYYNDTVPYRDTFKKITQKFRNLFGLKGDMVLHGPIDIVAEETTTQPVETTVTTSGVTELDLHVTTTRSTETTAVATEPPEQGEGEMSKGILIYQKRGISMYGGGFGAGEEYARALNRFKERLGEKVNVYSMVVPTACSFYMPERFQDRAGLEKANIDHINENLVDVKPVDVYSVLAKHTDEPIYMRTDHHWGALGSFYAAEEFSAVARVPFKPITSYEKVTLEGYVGTMYGYSGDITLLENPEDFNYYLPTVPYKNEYYDMRGQGGYEGNFFMNTDNMATVSWYLVYMGGDNRIAHLETEVKNGRTLAIIKDSYGNALAPWFTSSFENIYVIDMRYFEGDMISYLKNIGTTDLLFAMNTFSATGGNREHLTKMVR